MTKIPPTVAESALTVVRNTARYGCLSSSRSLQGKNNKQQDTLKLRAFCFDDCDHGDVHGDVHDDVHDDDHGDVHGDVHDVQYQTPRVSYHCMNSMIYCRYLPLIPLIP